MRYRWPSSSRPVTSRSAGTAQISPCTAPCLSQDASSGQRRQASPGRPRRHYAPQSRFLDAALPDRGVIAEEWDRQATGAPWSGVAVAGDRRGLGLAAEMRIGLDLTAAPGCRDLLSFLPPGEYEALLLGAGYSPAEGEHLADTGTADPLLLEWTRSSQPIGLDDGQPAALAACCDASARRNHPGGSRARRADDSPGDPILGPEKSAPRSHARGRRHRQNAW
jgi:hypothetical protein